MSSVLVGVLHSSVEDDLPVDGILFPCLNDRVLLGQRPFLGSQLLLQHRLRDHCLDLSLNHLLCQMRRSKFTKKKRKDLGFFCRAGDFKSEKRRYVSVMQVYLISGRKVGPKKKSKEEGQVDRIVPCYSLILPLAGFWRSLSRAVRLQLRWEKK